MYVKYYFYRPQRSWGKVMFSQACVILFTVGGCLPQCMLGYTHPPGADPPGADKPLPQSRHPLEQTPPSPGADTLPRADTPQPPPPGADTPHRACWEIRSTRGQCASYWNAILFTCILRYLQALGTSNASTLCGLCHTRD